MSPPASAGERQPVHIKGPSAARAGYVLKFRSYCLRVSNSKGSDNSGESALRVEHWRGLHMDPDGGSVLPAQFETERRSAAADFELKEMFCCWHVFWIDVTE